MLSQPIKRLQFHAMYFMAISFLLRPCDMTIFVMNRQNVKLPTSTECWDQDGFPQWIAIGLADCKGNLGGDIFWQLLKRNYVNSDLCPVMRLLTYLFFSGLDMTEAAPLFCCLRDGLVPNWNGQPPKQVKDGKYDVLAYYDRYGMAMHMNQQMWSGLHSEVFGNAALTTPDTMRGREVKQILYDAKTYSDRKNATKWAARSRATQAMIRSTGQWSVDSCEYLKYMEEELTATTCLAVRGGLDPILSM